MKKTLLIASAALVVTAGTAFAGTITLSNSALGTPGPVRIAKEIVDGNAAATPAVADLSAKITGYKPTSIPLGSLSSPAINVSVDAGKLTVAATAVVCDGAVVVASYSSGNGTTALNFQAAAGAAISNEVSYTIKKGACAALAAGDFTVSVPPATTGINLSISSGTSATQIVQDTATAKVVDVLTDFTATVKFVADAKVDPAQLFKKFNGPATTDTITVTQVRTVLDVGVIPTSTDDTVIKFALSDVSGMVTGTNTSVAMPGFSCVTNLTTKTATCTQADVAAAAGDFTATFTVNGTTALAERTFAVTDEITFTTAGTKAATVANSTALLNAAAAGSWTYLGTTLYIPLIKSASGAESYIKLQSSDTTPGANGVSAVILASDGTTVTANMGTITAGTPLLITGADLIAKVTAAGKTVNGANGFAAKITVYTDEPNLFGYAFLVDANGNKRIPIKVSGGEITE